MTMKVVFPEGTAAASDLAQCHVCETLTRVAGHDFCSFCGSPVHLRKPRSIQRTLAFLSTAVLLYLPANMLPIMLTTELGRTEGHTIAGGVLEFWKHGDFPIAIVIFVASLFIPVLKMLALGWLCLLAGSHVPVDAARLTIIHRITHIIGKWSMVDVFVVALTVALVQMGSLVSVQPGPGATAFAGVVIFTMLAAHSFDIRLIWDRGADAAGSD